MQLINRAVIEFQGGRSVALSLFKTEPTVFRWVAESDGSRFDSCDYVTSSDAVKGLRVLVDGDPGYVGADLTIYPVEPPPEERAARRIVEELEIEDGYHTPNPYDIEKVAEIIRQETAIVELCEHTQTLLAYLFTRRDAFAQALFPTVHGQRPRDMVMDGLLLSAIEAMGKATRQDYANLVKILKEPVSNLIVSSRMPPGGKIQ